MSAEEVVARALVDEALAGCAVEDFADVICTDLRDAGLLREQPLPEWRCPSCDAVTRARMADAPDGGMALTAEQVREVRELHWPAFRSITWSDPPDTRVVNDCACCRVTWPCPTLAILGLTDPEDSDDG